MPRISAVIHESGYLLGTIKPINVSSDMGVYRCMLMPQSTYMGRPITATEAHRLAYIDSDRGFDAYNHLVRDVEEFRVVELVGPEHDERLGLDVMHQERDVMRNETRVHWRGSALQATSVRQAKSLPGFELLDDFDTHTSGGSSET